MRFSTIAIIENLDQGWEAFELATTKVKKNENHGYRYKGIRSSKTISYQ